MSREFPEACGQCGWPRSVVGLVVSRQYLCHTCWRRIVDAEHYACHACGLHVATVALAADGARRGAPRLALCGICCGAAFKGGA